MRPSVFRLLAALPLLGCGAARHLPSSLGEQASGFGYVPLDGLSVFQGRDQYTCSDKQDATKPAPDWRPILEALPDVSVRFAVASVDGNGALSFGPTKVTTEGRTYRAVMDYVNVDVVAVPFYVRKLVRPAQGEGSPRGLLSPLANDETIAGFEAHVYYKSDEDPLPTAWKKAGFDRITVPVYVGIGLRLSADIRALKGNVALSSLGAIASEAQANALAGTLTVQTLGIMGQGMASALPMPSKLDQTTVENGILALGSSRALIYSQESNSVVKMPRIVGLYSPVQPDPRLINVIYSELAANPPSWFRPCGPSPKTPS